MSRQSPFDWAAVDWSRPTGEIVAMSGRGARHVSRMRRRHAPETIFGVDWDSQPLGREMDTEIAARLGVPSNLVAKARIRRGIPAAQRKRCVECGTWFVRRRDASGHLERSTRWQERRYCGHACANEANKGARWRAAEARRLAAVEAVARYGEKRHAVWRRVAVVEARGLTARRRAMVEREHAKMLALAADAAVALMRWAVRMTRTKGAGHE